MIDLGIKKVDKIYGIPKWYFLPFAAVVIIAMFTGNLPEGMVGAVALLVVMGGFGQWIGLSLPVVRDIGGALLVPMFGCIILKHIGFFPEYAVDIAKTFINSGYQELYIAAILVGSILAMNRKILIGSLARYIPTILISQAVALAFLFLSSIVTGKSFYETVFFIGVPCMAGGSGGAMTTLPQMYSSILGKDVTDMSGQLLATAQLGDWTGLACAVLLSILATKFPKVIGNGNGEILRVKDAKGMKIEKEDMPNTTSDFGQLGAGLFISLGCMVAGSLLAAFVPAVADLAWTIIVAIVLKVSGILPNDMCKASNYWNRLAIKIGLPILIAGLAIGKMSLAAIISVFSLDTIVVILFGLLGAVLGAMLGAKLFGLWPYEAAITGALCSCNIGGSGDIRMLTVTDRMNLLPFASISTRLGGGLMLIEVSLLFPIAARIVGAL